jgi:Fe-S-cluster-containing dehydrogenase component
MENSVGTDIHRINVINPQGTTILDRPVLTNGVMSFDLRPVPCQHCDMPVCISVCPSGASFKRADGLVMVDKEICDGCGSCVTICPYGARAIDRETSKVDKCQMCSQRLDDGIETTICELCCPNRAITQGDLDDKNSAVSKIIAKYDTSLYLEDKGTNPNVYYYNSVPMRQL